jgi:predicted DNA-binding mobile mystery protein A
MRTSKKSRQIQRKLIERKVQPWLSIREEIKPPSGWIRAVRNALGITTRQLAQRIGVKHAAITQFETKEAEGKVTLETLEKLARAMRCKLVYAIVPESSFKSLEEILNHQAELAARAINARVDHTMRLEKQGIAPEQSNELVRELAEKLKDELDSSLWDEQQSLLSRKKTK